MAIEALTLEPFDLPEAALRVRGDVRDFIAAERAAGRLADPERIGLGFDKEMGRRIGERGWIGMTWPKQYGGGERSALERYVVMEELLAAAVPVGSYWIADRQSGPVLLKFGTEAQKARFLPGIACGDLTFCIGMSEPGAGSDLAALVSRADRIDGNWRLNGHKLWTTNAHLADFIIVLVRTSKSERRHEGFSQFIIDARSPGVTIRPVISMAGEHDFNEVFLDDVLVGDDALIGVEGNGWQQVSAELAYERSGPERWLSSFRLLVALLPMLDRPTAATEAAIGRLAGQLIALRQMSIAVAGMLQRGTSPDMQAATVKELGTRFEQELVRIVADIALAEGIRNRDIGRTLCALIDSGLLWSPAFTIRGGAVEILRGIIARGLGLR